MTADNIDRLSTQGGSDKSREIYWRLLQSVKASIVVVDRDGVFHFANRVAAQAMDRTLDDMVGRSMWELFPQDIADRQMARVRSVIDEGREYFEEWRTRTGGEWRWYDMVLQPFHDSPETFTTCMVIAHDITARKHSEQLQHVLHRIANAANTTKDLQELYGSIREELNAVIDTANFCIAVYNRDTNCISLPYNVDKKDKFDHFPAGKTLMSYVIRNDTSLLATSEVQRDLTERGEVETIGAPAPIWVGVPLKVRGRVIGAVSVQHYTEESAYTEKDLEILEFASGQIAVAIERKQAEEALQAANEELERRVGERTAELEKTNAQLRKEIAHRCEVEDALRESERRYSLATTAGRVGVWDWDMKTNEIYVDPRLKALLGYEEDEIPNHLDHWNKLVHPEDSDEMGRRIADHVEGWAPQFEFEHRMIHKDGSVRWILARGNVIRDEEGQPYRMIGTDITELKHAEVMLRKTADEPCAERKVLAEKKVALKQILQHIENERKDYQRKICQDIQQILEPDLKRLKQETDENRRGNLEL